MTTTGGKVLAAALAAALLASGCSSTSKEAAPSSSAAADAPDGGADVSKMDTGSYATVPNPPYGTAGDDTFKQGMLEAQRLGAVTVGPWEVNPALIGRGAVDLTAGITGHFPDAQVMRQSGAFGEPLPDIAGRHGLMAGFTSVRFAPTQDPKARAKFWSLLTAVMRFPTPEAARAAAAEMAAADPPPAGADGPRQAVQLSGHPDALAVSYPLSDGRESLRSFTPKGVFVLYQGTAMVRGAFDQGTMFLTPDSLVFTALSDQLQKLENFTPTPADRLPDLPMDPSGYLMARVLDDPAHFVPASVGVWTPPAWVHFEDNPPQAAAWLKDAGVDFVAQRLATIYRTRNAETAETLLQKIVAQMRGTAPAKPAGEVPGLPRARCFERDTAAIFDEAAASLRRIAWHFKCAAATDRYVFTVYGPSHKDVAQRISAQYRILAGK